MTTAATRDDTDDGMRLVDRAAAGDVRAFEQLYRANERRLYALCLRMTGNVSEAEECVQSAFIRAWKNLPGFRKKSAVSSWLHRIAVNEVLGRIRRRKRHAAHLKLLTAQADCVGQPGRQQGDGSEHDVESAVMHLPDGARHVFVLVGVYGYTHAEAADLLGIAPGTCKAQLHRARALLKTRLGIDD